MFPWRTKSALLIDFDNVHITLRDRGRADFAERIPHWLAWLQDGGPDGTRRKFLTKRVYWNGGFDLHRRAFEDAGFEAHACRGHTNFKRSSADIVMALDAMELLTEYKALEEIVILTMDTDFVPVVTRMKNKGLSVVAMGNEENSSAATFREYATAVISLAEMRAALDYTPPPAGLFGWLRAPARKELALAEGGQTAPRAEVREGRAPPAPPSQRRRRAPAPRKPAPASFDLEAVADKIVRVASASPGSLLSKATIRKVAIAIDGFQEQGARAWFGTGGYRSFVEEMARRRPTELKLRKYPEGGVVLVATTKGEGD